MCVGVGCPFSAPVSGFVACLVSRFGLPPFQRVVLAHTSGHSLSLGLAMVFLFGMPLPVPVSATTWAPPSRTLLWHLFLALTIFLLFSFCFLGAVSLCLLLLGVSFRSCLSSPDPRPCPSAPSDTILGLPISPVLGALRGEGFVSLKGLSSSGLLWSVVALFFLILLDYVIFA